MTQGEFGLRALLPALAVLAMTALASSAQAQVSSAQQSAIRDNCRSDFMSHCSGVTPGGKDALVCLQKNVASLSPGCQTAVSATMPAPAAATAAAPAPPPAATTTKITAAPPPPPHPPKAELANAR